MSSWATAWSLPSPIPVANVGFQRTATLLVLVALATACADDETEPGTIIRPNAQTGANAQTDAGTDAQTDAATTISVDPSTPVSDLTSVEAQALCAEYDTMFDELVPPAERLRFNCTVTGIFTPGFDGSVTTDEELQEACVPIRDMCIEMGSRADDFRCPLAAGTDCAATVQQVETCFVEELQANAEFFATISCETARLAQTGGQGLGDIDLPQSCVSLYEQCPELE